LENLNLALNFLLFYGLEDLDNALLVIYNVDAFEYLSGGFNRGSAAALAGTYLGVFSSSYFSNDLVVILSSPLNGQVVCKAESDVVRPNARIWYHNPTKPKHIVKQYSSVKLCLKKLTGPSLSLTFAYTLDVDRLGGIFTNRLATV
jgi:hypothetical protein